MEPQNLNVSSYDDPFIVKQLEKFGDVGMWLIPTAVGSIAFFSGYRFIPLGITLLGLIQKISVEALKKHFPKQRPRPFKSGIESKEDSQSFPSSHTAGAFLGYGMSCGLYGLNSPFAITILCLALLVGLSRITAKKHWPLDVTAGAAIGTFTGLLTCKLFA